MSNLELYVMQKSKGDNDSSGYYEHKQLSFNYISWNITLAHSFINDHT